MKECAKPGTDRQQWTIAEYLEALEHPRAEEGFRARHGRAGAVRSLHLMVYAVRPPEGRQYGNGLGLWRKEAEDVRLWFSESREPDLMVKMAVS